MQELIRKIGAHEGALPMSWSRVNLLLTCPRQFDLRYRQKVKAEHIPEDPSAAEAGKLMHRVLELAVERCKNMGNYAYESSGYEALFGSILRNATYPGTRERMLSLREPSANVLARVLGMARKFNAQTWVERRLSLGRDWKPMERFSWNWAAWLGYVDLTMLSGGKCIIVDYKSEPYTADKSEQTEMQTLLYAYAIMRQSGCVEHVQTVTAFLQDERFVPSGSYAWSSMPDMEERLRHMFTTYLEALESGDKQPRKSSLCQWCAFSTGCPAQPEEREKAEEELWQEEKRKTEAKP